MHPLQFLCKLQGLIVLKFRMALAGVVSVMLMSVGIIVLTPSAASANSQTCLAAPNGTLCTIVYGNEGWVDAVGVSRMKISPVSGELFGICDYDAWFFAIHTDGKVESLGFEKRLGCGLGRVWLIEQLHRGFPSGTEMCAKFYENRWNTFVSEKCVGLS